MTDDSHRINRDRRGEDDEPEETFTCEYCGEEYDDRDKFKRHREREKRKQFQGTELGEVILDIDRQRRAKF